MISPRLIEYGLEADGGWAETPAKINLWLEVLGRREDGFHEVETLMAPVTLFDRLEIKCTGETDGLTVEGIEVPTCEDNLVLQVLKLARGTRKIPPVQVHLTKRIPPRTGLGGGSSDAAAMLLLLDAIFPEPGGIQELKKQGASIGTDVPFFLGEGPAFATGRGEKIRPFSGPFLGGDPASFQLIFPEMGLRTPEVYAALSEDLTSGDSYRNFPLGSFQESSVWVHSLYNRLLEGARRIEPYVDELVRSLELLAPGRWAMTGSGSCFVVASMDETSSTRDAEILKVHFHEVAESAGRSGPPPVEIKTVSLLTPIQ